MRAPFLSGLVMGSLLLAPVLGAAALPAGSEGAAGLPTDESGAAGAAAVLSPTALAFLVAVNVAFAIGLMNWRR